MTESLREYHSLVYRHDHFYMMSDDPIVYMKGAEELDKIYQLEETLPKTKCLEIWNDIVKQKFKNDYERLIRYV